MKNEDQNFSLFNYVNEQQNEVEKLEEQLHQLEEEKQKFAQVCIHYCDAACASTCTEKKIDHPEKYMYQ